MKSAWARVVVCVALLAALAIAAGSLVSQRQFDLVSGQEWAERTAAADRATRSAISPSTPPSIANGWILLAGGLIVSVLGLAIHAQLDGAARPTRRVRPELP